jgi:cobalamin biosynthesis protein CobW
MFTKVRGTPMASKIPVTIITGFLGSGKTTLIRHLLMNNQGQRIAVLVNEFGELGIDGELLRSCGVCPEDEAPNQIIELTNGCLCCTVQEEFFPAMQQLLERRQDIDCIVIETSGLALPKPLVTAFRWPEIKNAATVDAVIAVVDAEAVFNGRFASNVALVDAARQADDNLDHETPLQELFEDQLACADLVIVNKTDLVTDADYAAVLKIIQQHTNPAVKVINSDRGQVAPEKILGWQAAVEDNLADRPSHHDAEEEHEHDDGITAAHITLAQEFDPITLRHLLEKLVQEQEIYRVKGFMAVPHKPMRMVVQGVGQRFDQFFDRPWRPNEPRLTQLVFIGQQLDAAAIRSRLEAIITAAKV